MTRFGRALVLFVLLISAGLCSPLQRLRKAPGRLSYHPMGKVISRPYRQPSTASRGNRPHRATSALERYVRRKGVHRKAQHHSRRRGMNATIITASIARDAWRCRHKRRLGSSHTHDVDGVNDGWPEEPGRHKQLWVRLANGYHHPCPLDTVNRGSVPSARVMTRWPCAP